MESALSVLDLLEPFLPIVDDRTPELVLLEAPDFPPRGAAPPLVEPRAHAPSCEGFLMPPWPDLVGLLLAVSRLGGLQTSGSSMGAPDEVGYSSSG